MEYPKSDELIEKENEDIQALLLYNEIEAFNSGSSDSVASTLEKVKKIIKQLQKDIESTDAYGKLRLGCINSQLLSEIKENVDITKPILEGFTEEFENESINVEHFETKLEEFKSSTEKSFKMSKLLTVMCNGLKRMSLADSTDNTLESIESIFASSDFLGKNQKVATSSPFTY